MVNEEKFIKTFTSCESCENFAALGEISVDEPALIGEGKCGEVNNALDSIPKEYIFTKKDQIISFASQLKIAKNVGARELSVIDTGHVPMYTNPELVAAAILQAR